MFGATVSVEAGFLEVVKATATAEWNLTQTQTTTDTIEDTATITWGVSGNIGPNETIEASAVVWEGILDLPYTATVTVVMAPSTGLAPLQYTDSGVYKNVVYSTAQVTVNDPAKPKDSTSAKILDVLAARRRPMPLAKYRAQIETAPAPAVPNDIIVPIKSAPVVNGVGQPDDNDLKEQLNALQGAISGILRSKEIMAH